MKRIMSMIISKTGSHARVRYRNPFLYLFGITLISMGVVLTINSHAGAGGYDALNFALGEQLGIETSVAICLTSALAVIVTAIIRGGFPRIITFLSSFCIGIMTDFWKTVLSVIQGDSFFASAAILVAGMSITGLGIASYMLSGLPTNPTDDMIVAMKEAGMSIRTGKIAMDVICVVLALIFGGEIGWGTVVVTIGLGPIVQYFHSIISIHISERTVTL